MDKHQHALKTLRTRVESQEKDAIDYDFEGIHIYNKRGVSLVVNGMEGSMKHPQLHGDFQVPLYLPLSKQRFL